MIVLNHDEAILFRVLSSFFGTEHVIPNMSVMAVCGGELPAVVMSEGRELREIISRSIDLDVWARKSKCLFTIVDRSDKPCMVIEFFSGYSSSIDYNQVEHQRYLQPILKAAGISYVTMTDKEFSEIVNPSSTLDFFAFLQSKVDSSLTV